ncbi:LytR/AlgR family response regulator transcription factor [Pseudochryseolinea flava]|uniref:DNA-binding response regulator n=1 Tax=Pseudochryseolinea flava TaxID=2059302 RepID=A0A364Y3R5_9BACT|nr:LytTR family DNA-binding domain-containing protein [Pseudochryseolinea flava]RAW00436.1 DNA-binding response regulator [Pseudochryseolinea flava]
MLKAIAIDDEPIALEVIKTFSSKTEHIDLIGSFTDAFKAMDFLKMHSVDLIFLDIKMPDISGIDFLKALHQPPMVIFTTAYSEHAVQSFELDAIDYLLKPIALTRFLKACNKAFEQHQLRYQQPIKDHVFIKSGYEQIKVALAAIRYVESNGNYVQFVIDGKKIISRLTMTEASDLLPPTTFVRVHRFYIVSKLHVTRLDKRTVWVGENEIPIGPGFAEKASELVR